MLTLIVPGLLRIDRSALKHCAALEALARYAEPPQRCADGIAAATVAAFGLAQNTGVAPLYAIGAGSDDDDRYTIAATPVTLVADRDVVALAARVDDLHRDEAQSLIDLLNRHFASDGVAFDAPRASAWFARCERPYALSMPSLDAAMGRPIHRFLPRGADASAWQRWQVEIQMLFHEHRVNREREEARRAPVTTVWLWGGGRRSDVAKPLATAVFATQNVDGDLARGLAGHAGLSADTLPQTISPIIDGHRWEAVDFVALDTVHDENALMRVGDAWLQPAIVALEKGALRGLRLITDGDGSAITWTADHPSLLARMATRLRQRAFEVPARSES